MYFYVPIISCICICISPFLFPWMLSYLYSPENLLPNILVFVFAIKDNLIILMFGAENDICHTLKLDSVALWWQTLPMLPPRIFKIYKFINSSLNNHIIHSLIMCILSLYCIEREIQHRREYWSLKWVMFLTVVIRHVSRVTFAELDVWN